MASDAATLVLKILGEAKDAVAALNTVEQEIEKTEKATKAAGDTTKKTGKAMAGVWTGVAAAMGACVRASSQLESATVAVNTIFADQADEMLEWASGMAQYGLSTAQAAGAAAVLGAQLKNTGLTAEQMTILTQGLIETSTQLAAVMGGSAVDAAAAMGAALRGEFDTLERYGISLTADAVATEVARLKAEGYTFATEQQAKMIATCSLIQQQATTILGENTEEQITAKEATEHLKASIQNLAGELGGPLSTALGVVIDGTATFIDKLTGAISESELLTAVSGPLKDILQTIGDICDTVLTPALELLQDVMGTLSDFLERTVVPILEVLSDALDTISIALEKVIGWVNGAIDAFQRFVDSLQEAWDALTFWNNNAEVETPEGAVMRLGTAPLLRLPSTRNGSSTAPGTVNVTVNAGMVAEPHQLAREIRRVLKSDALRMGRAA